MIQLILMLSVNAIQPTQTAQIQPCNWPNKCAVQQPVIVAQASPCNWPNRCEKTEPIVNL